MCLVVGGECCCFVPVEDDLSLVCAAVLEGSEPIQDIIDLTIHTAYVKFERIISLLLVSETEAGKTELIKKFRKNKGVHPRRRFTAYGIINDLLSKFISLQFSWCSWLDILLFRYIWGSINFSSNEVGVGFSRGKPTSIAFPM